VRHYLLAGVSLVAALFVSACGDGDQELETPPTIPLGTPVITNGRFEFAARGYSVQIPEGWTSDANAVTGPDFAADVFFAPEETNGVKPNIAVTCYVLEPGPARENYVENRVGLIRDLAKDEPRTSDGELAGLDTLIVEYAPQVTGEDIEKTDVLFVHGRCGWIITLTVSAGQREAYQDIFESFLASYQPLEE
jgi:hypothetical protein